MELSIFNKFFAGKAKQVNKSSKLNKARERNAANIAITEGHDLTSADIDTTYEIKAIKTNDKEVKNFLFSLGCFEGESITVISLLADNYIINVKDVRYSIDTNLARAIVI